MNRRKLIRSLTLTTLASSFCLLGGAQTFAASPKDAPVRSLAVGQSLRYDSGLKLTFVKVRNDSRCPMGALCIWAGDAEVVLIAKVGNQPDKIIRIHTYSNPTSVSIPAAAPGTISTMKTYYVKIARLSPQPRIGSTIKQSDYRLALDISVSNPYIAIPCFSDTSALIKNLRFTQ